MCCSDVHSYTNLLNAYVRCGDISGAESVWTQMLQPPTSAPITPNVVTCTTLIKGYCENGMLGKAKRVFMSMIHHSSACITDMSNENVDSGNKSKVARREEVIKLPDPNTRTLNTFLRGCIRYGAVNIAKQIFISVAQFENSKGVVITDESSLEYMISLHCQSLQITDASDLYDLFMKLYSAGNSVGVSPHANSQFSAINVYLSRGHALLSNLEESEKFRNIATEAIKNAKSNILLDAMKASAEKAKGQGNGGADGNNTSILFQQHRYAELLRECDLIESYNQCQRSVFHSDHSQALKALSRVLLFSDLKFSTTSDCDDGKNEPTTNPHDLKSHKRKRSSNKCDSETNDWSHELKASLVRNLQEIFGLEQLCCSGDDPNLKTEVFNEIIRNISPVSRKINKICTRSGYCVRFDRLFALCSATKGNPCSEQKISCFDALTDETFQVKMEIGSGSGEWVVQQAISDYNNHDIVDNVCEGYVKQRHRKVLWVSLEQVYIVVGTQYNFDLVIE